MSIHDAIFIIDNMVLELDNTVSKETDNLTRLIKLGQIVVLQDTRRRIKYFLEDEEG